MLEISVLPLAPWDELKHRLETEEPAQVDIMDYLQGNADSPVLPTPSNRAHTQFFDQLNSILKRCPDELKDGIRNVFFSLVYANEDGSGLVESKEALPTIKAYHQNDDTWGWVHSSISPETVQQVAAYTAQFNIDVYEPYFRAKRREYFNSFEYFRKYAQAWLDMIREAADLNAGLVIIIQ